MIASSTANESRDWVRKPLALVLWWGLPILGGISSNFLGLSLAQEAFLLAVAFAWAGTGCVLRFGVVSAPHALDDVVNATVVLVVLSCLPEWFWGRYYTLKT
ncbi:MAG: hypothetical protein ACREV7_20265 [Steroidobacteraceae bacterium]